MPVRQHDAPGIAWTPPRRVTPAPPAAPHTTTSPPCGHQPCAVPGDAGVAAAIARYRSTHGLSAVAVEVTAAAQRCAVSQGDPGPCPTPYASAVGYTRDGARAVRSVAADPSTWLGDPQLDRVQVGWAYLPARRLLVCALLDG
jgi:hypothetical protein